MDDRNRSKISKIWQAVEDKTALRRSKATRYPLGRLDVHAFLPTPTDEFDDIQKLDFVSPLMRGGRKVKDRKRQIRLDDVLSAADKTKAKRRDLKFDIRDRAKIAHTTIRTKRG